MTWRLPIYLWCNYSHVIYYILIVAKLTHFSILQHIFIIFSISSNVIMKKITLILCLTLLFVTFEGYAKKKQAEISFVENSYNFGTIPEKGGSVSHTFEFTNTGDGNLVIVDASADCGCTVPEFPVKPIAPGHKGVIKVTFNPLYRPGAFTKVVTVKTNGKPKKARIKIQGTVNPNKQ